MKTSQNADFLASIVEILRHIKEVEGDVRQKSKESMLKIESFFVDGGVAPSSQVVEAMQYQDIMSQQLSATIEAIEAIERSIAMYTHSFKHDTELLGENLQNLNDKLKKSLETAKTKKESFGGKASDESVQEIEFF